MGPYCLLHTAHPGPHCIFPGHLTLNTIYWTTEEELVQHPGTSLGHPSCPPTLSAKVLPISLGPGVYKVSQENSLGPCHPVISRGLALVTIASSF